MTERVTAADTIRNHLLSVAKTSGLFLDVEDGEPASPPDSRQRIYAAVVEGPGAAVPAYSSLNGLTLAYAPSVQLYRQLPVPGSRTEAPSYESAISTARDTFLAALAADVVVAPGIEFDPGGQGGTTLSWEPGWVDADDNVLYRACVVSVPFIAFNALPVAR